jgi:hypothetical protein
MPRTFKPRNPLTADAARIFYQRLLAVLFIMTLGASPSMADITSSERADTTSKPAHALAGDDRPAELLSAFFGLDNDLPLLARMICKEAPGRDGMPVIFSTEIDQTTMQAGDFQVMTASGNPGTVHCVTLLPATGAGELRTVLMIGEFGDAETNPPVSVEIVGHLHSIDGRLDFRDAHIDVTPLAAGPTIVMAEVADLAEQRLSLGPRRTRGTECPDHITQQALRVVWAGGVVLQNGEEVGETERDLYRVTLRAEDGTERSVSPVAIADLGDGDNNHLLCLDTADTAVSISFPAGILADPNGDLNPASSITLPKAR